MLGFMDEKRSIATNTKLDVSIFNYYILCMKRPVYIFAFGEYNSKQVNVSGIKISVRNSNP